MMPRLRLAVGLGAALAALAGAWAGADAPAPPAAGDAAVRLPAFTVHAAPLTGFGLSLRMIALRQTKQILRIFVRAVQPDSEAETGGLEAGTEILSIDGRSVTSFAVRFDPESDLGRLLVNRRRGEPVRLVVVPPGGTRARTVVLIRGRTRPRDPMVLDWPP
jgi:C-terminal processing protease CtpA/Prc